MTSFLFLQGPIPPVLHQYMHTTYTVSIPCFLALSFSVSLFLFSFSFSFSWSVLLVCHSVHSWVVDLSQRKKD